MNELDLDFDEDRLKRQENDRKRKEIARKRP